MGGALLPGYSHTYNTISELTASDAPNLPLVQLFFTVYNICLLLYAWGLYKDAYQQPRLRVEAVMLFCVGLLGLAMYFYPQDARSMQMTFNGKMHLALAGIMSPLTILAMVFAGLGFRKAPLARRLGAYSFTSCIATFVTGGMSAIAVASNSSYGGLFERLTIGSFLHWLLVMSLLSPNLHRSDAASNPTSGYIAK
jgi:uncharacterized membrane protein